MYRIGIISDTHGLLRPEIKFVLNECDVIFHGGDITKEDILDELGRMSSIYAVRGNNDKEWAAHLREVLVFDLYGLRFLLVHDKKRIPPAKLKDVDIVVYGHSHKFNVERIGERLWINPGSCGPRRFVQPVSMAMLEIEDESFQLIKIEIEEGISREIIANGSVKKSY